MRSLFGNFFLIFSNFITYHQNVKKIFITLRCTYSALSNQLILTSTLFMLNLTLFNNRGGVFWTFNSCNQSDFPIPADIKCQRG